MTDDLSTYSDQPHVHTPQKLPSRCTETWTEERIAKLKKLWAEGLSASQIAGRLCGVTRNAVIGKAHRLGLAERKRTPALGRPPKRGGKKRTRAPKRGVAKIIASLSSEPLPEPRVTDVARVQLQDLQEHHCRWPAGDPVRGFCGHQKVKGLPYCEAHARRAYEAPAVKAERARKREQGKTFAPRKDRKLGVIGYV